MRIAVLYDIHGNLPALEAVLDEVRQAGVDQIVVGGDVVPGPMPNECAERLFDLGIPLQCIRGNGDRVVLAQAQGIEPAEVPETFRDVIRWNARVLRPEHQRLMAAWPETVRADIPGVGRTLFCHATPRNDTEIFTRRTADERLRPIFDGAGARLVVCGHTHMQFDRTIGDVRVVNAGSVGMPFGEPGAYWLLLGPAVELRRTAYDLVKAAERVRGTAYPQAEDFAATSVLQPPPEEVLLQAYARAELR